MFKKIYNRISAIFFAILCVFSSIFVFNQKVMANEVYSQVYDKSNYQEPYATDRIIVALKTDSDKQVALDSQGLMLQKRLPTVDKEYDLGLYTVENKTTEGVVDAIETLKSNPAVAYAEPDYILTATDTIPNDPGYSELYGLEKISAPAAWDSYTGSDNAVVGIVDTGVEYTHSDLSENIWVNPGEIAGNNVDDDNNGYVDDVYGWNFVDDNNAPLDDNGHGTHVAGTIGAVGDNNVGVVGVTWKTQIAALKFLASDGSGYTSDAIEAIHYAAEMGFEILNNSWGGGSYSQSMKNAIDSYEGVFVAAAGNYGTNNDRWSSYPASYSSSNIIAVAATDESDAMTYYSNYGATSVDLGAPGDAIYSTYLNNSYATLSGTSMATPQVSGAAALIKSYNPALTTAQIKSLLLENVDQVSSLSGRTVSGGRLNVEKSLAAAD